MDNTLCSKAGLRIRQMRKEKGYTRDRLAAETGVSSKFLYEIEQGRKRFSAETLCRIAKALDVSCDYIMRDEPLQGCEVGIIEVISLFDSDQQRKLIPILKLMYEFIK